jgi:TRAP-type mannitol/chloroaromatic compound transport system permease small subunit
MPRALELYAVWVTRFNRRIGRLMMWGVYLLLALLLWGAFSRNALNAPLPWAVEMSQFMLAGYYILGGAWSMQMGAHVRMDLLYGRWSRSRMAFADSLTSFCLIFYLAVLLLGGFSSTAYAIEYGQKNYSSWAPPLAPIKIVMTFGVFLMLLQAVAYLIRDIARVRGHHIPGLDDEEAAA